MLGFFTSILSKPKKVIPTTLVLALLIGALSWNRLGVAPVVGNLGTESQLSSAGAGTVSLSFSASGKVANVGVKLGDRVTAGEMLASLDSAAAQGAVSQAKGALDLAKAQSGSMSVQYDNAKTTQDLLVENAYSTLLSSGLTALPIGVGDESHNPIITGTYTCDKEGSYEIDPYTSSTQSGFSFNVKGLENSNGVEVTYGTPKAFGNCGLQITFVQGFSPSSRWIVSIPNTKASTYQANLNAYNLALATRAQVLSQLSANLGTNGTTSADVASASVSAAQGAYEAALANLHNQSIVSPVSGTVSFIDPSLKVGQAVSVGHPVISVSTE